MIPLFLTQKNISSILQQLAIPIMLTLLLIYYGVKLYFFHDTDAIRTKNSRPLKDKPGYAREAGILMLFFSVFSLLGTLLMAFYPLPGFGILLLTIALVFLQFRRLEEKYT